MVMTDSRDIYKRVIICSGEDQIKMLKQFIAHKINLITARKT